MSWVWFAIVGYLCGSIPFGLILTRMAGLGDVRSIGSGNIGATNVLRTGNKKIAALTLLCDGLKGYFPVLAAQLADTPHAAIAAGFGALAGHVFPVWLKFKGGKGVATGLGVLFGWQWLLGLLFCAVWLIMFKVKRVSSLSALTAIALTAAGTWAVAAYHGETGMPGLFIPALILAVVIFATHHANIRRLLKGEEPQSNFSKPK